MLLFKAVVLSALLGQSSVDQRSPFGANAPTNNNLRPERVPTNRPGDQAPASFPSSSDSDQAASTNDTPGSASSSTPAPATAAPPASLPSDTANTADTNNPSDTSATTGGAQSTTRSAKTPIVRPDLSVSPTPGSVTPGTERSTSTPIRGASGVTGTSNTPGSNSMPAPQQAPSSTAPIYPGASSGASNTQ